MPGFGQIPTGEAKSRLTRVILGVVLLALVTGLWVYLWVPPWP